MEMLQILLVILVIANVFAIVMMWRSRPRRDAIQCQYERILEGEVRKREAVMGVAVDMHINEARKYHPGDMIIPDNPMMALKWVYGTGEIDLSFIPMRWYIESFSEGMYNIIDSRMDPVLSTRISAPERTLPEIFGHFKVVDTDGYDRI